jgi:hypothetical protein
VRNLFLRVGIPLPLRLFQGIALLPDDSNVHRQRFRGLVRMTV